MTVEEWNHGSRAASASSSAAKRRQETDERGTPVRDDSFLVLFNAHHDPIAFHLPDYGAAGWMVLVDTDRDEGLLPDGTFQPHGIYLLGGRSLALLQQVPRPR